MMPSSTPVVHHTNGVQNQRAAAALVGLTGNFDVPGGNVSQPASWLETAGAGFITREHEFEHARPWSDHASPSWGASVPGLDRDGRPRPGDGPAPADQDRPALSPARHWWRFGMNHRMWPDSNGLIAAVDKLDFVCVADLVPHRHGQARRHRPAGLQLGGAERAALLSAEVRRSSPSLSSSRWAKPAPTPTSSSAWLHKLGLDDPLLNPPGGEAQTGSRQGRRQPPLRSRRSRTRLPARRRPGFRRASSMMPWIGYWSPAA